jgi:acylphosphatase
MQAEGRPPCYSRFSVSRHPQAARLYLVRGRVQGVGYRDYAQRVASTLGVTGYVRNLDDGRVEVYAAGPPDKLSDLAAALRRGPRFSEVRGVDEQEAAPQRYSDFQIEV